MKNTTNKIAHNNGNVNAFELAKRAFEMAYRSGNDYTRELENLATAIAKSVLNKVIDPQRKVAAEKLTISNSGINKALDDIKRGIYYDGKHLANVRHWSNADSVTRYDRNGDMITETDSDASAALDALMDYTITDGYDLVQSAIVALLDMANAHCNCGDNWLDVPFTVNRLSRRVYIRETDSRAYRTEETTPIQEVYRAVRRAITNSRAVITDPRNGYTYISIDAHEPEALEQIFVRSGKYADVGGVDCRGLYTGDIEALKAYNDVDTLLARLNLTAREVQIIKLRMRGYSARSIADYIGISVGSFSRSLSNIQRKARENGFNI